MEADGVDVAHFPANYGPKGRYASVVTVNDALNLFRISEHWRGFGKRPRQVALMAYLGWKTRRALRTADRLVTISEHARGELARRGRCPIDRITAIHDAAGEEFRVIPDPSVMQDARRRWTRRRLTVLADGIKNPAALIAAFDALPGGLRDDTELLFFSREPSPRPAVAAAMADPAVRFVPRPGTEELVTLMNLATVFVFPSWYEGFGLPLVEAMSCGAPVIASTRGSIPEVLGGAGLLFDVERPAELTHHLRAVLESESLRQDLRARGLSRSRDFSWRTTALRTLEVYQLAARGRTPRPRT
jgi:glycosyltransferase involved in cell wall biosynthesis